MQIMTKPSRTEMALRGSIHRIAETSVWVENRQRVERVLRQRIAHTLSLLKLPSTDDVHTLSQQLDRLEREVDQMRTRLEQASALAPLAALIPAIAHDICTPVGNSNLAASALRESLAELRAKLNDDKLKKSELNEFLDRCEQGLGMIETAGARIGELSESLKHLSVDQASGRLRSFDLGALGAEVLTTLGPTLRTSSIRVEKHFDAAIQMNSYPGALGQVLINLLQNAMLHAFPGRAGGTIQMAAKRVGVGYVRIEVSDDGVGLSQEARDKIFTPFFTTRAADGGSGVGLSYSKRLVETELGGSISLAATSRSGTRFVIELPMDVSQRN